MLASPPGLALWPLHCAYPVAVALHRSCCMVEWSRWVWSLSQWQTGFLRCVDAVGWVIWPVKAVPKMTYVSSGTLSLCSFSLKGVLHLDECINVVNYSVWHFDSIEVFCCHVEMVSVYWCRIVTCVCLSFDATSIISTEKLPAGPDSDTVGYFAVGVFSFHFLFYLYHTVVLYSFVFTWNVQIMHTWLCMTSVSIQFDCFVVYSPVSRLAPGFIRVHFDANVSL